MPTDAEQLVMPSMLNRLLDANSMHSASQAGLSVRQMVDAVRDETAVTRDRELSAQFEHTVGVTAGGCEVFTFSPAGLHRPPYDVKRA